jgi:hypothetical protein
MAQLPAQTLVLVGMWHWVGEGEVQALSKGWEVVPGDGGQEAGQVGGVHAEVAHHMVMELQGFDEDEHERRRQRMARYRKERALRQKG